jgi:hypothetical protein
MDGQRDGLVESNETTARFVAYLGPYLFWGVVCAITAGIWLLR